MEIGDDGFEVQVAEITKIIDKQLVTFLGACSSTSSTTLQLICPRWAPFRPSAIRWGGLCPQALEPRKHQLFIDAGGVGMPPVRKFFIGHVVADTG